MSNPRCHRGARHENSVFEGANVIFNNTQVYDCEVGFGSCIAMDSLIWKARIGRYSSIGENVRTCFGNHPTSRYVSTYSGFYDDDGTMVPFCEASEPLLDEHRWVDEDKRFVVDIGSDVWIGNDVRILDGVTIGDGAVIGLGAVIRRDVPPYSVWIGNPAQKKSDRFSAEIRQFLLRFRWWERDEQWIRAHQDDFRDVERFYLRHRDGLAR